jgi:hypothetical protein
MFCHACGTEVPNGKRYCQQCGTAQLAASADKGRRANWRLSAWVVGGAVVVSLGVGGVIGYVAARSAVAASAEATAIRVEEQYEAAAEEQRARSFKLGYDAGAASTEVPGGGGSSSRQVTVSTLSRRRTIGTTSSDSRGIPLSTMQSPLWQSLQSARPLMTRRGGRASSTAPGMLRTGERFRVLGRSAIRVLESREWEL